MLYLWNMTVAGSIMFLMYFVLGRILKKHWLCRQRYFLLKAVLVYYLVPLAPLSDLYWFLIRMMSGGFLDRVVDMHNGSRATNISYLMVRNPVGLIYPNIKLIIQLTIFLGYLVGAMIVLIKRIRNYMWMRKMVHQQIRLFHSGNTEAYQILEELRKEYKIKRKIELCTLQDSMHCTMGIFRPAIIMGELPKDRKKLELIIRHELTHIKRNDFLFRIILEFVECVHWFNPLKILLERDFEQTSELACDEQVMWRAGEEERKLYARLLIEQSTGKNYFGKWASSLAKRNVQKRERIDTIMNDKIPNKFAVAGLVILIGLTIWANSLNAMAYNGVNDATTEPNGYTDLNFNENEMFVPDEIDDVYMIPNLSIVYGEEFIDEEGNIYPISNGDSINSICDHNFIHGTIQQHTRHLNGGCTVRIIDGQRCTRCGDVIYGELLSTHEYTKCPH